MEGREKEEERAMFCFAARPENPGRQQQWLIHFTRFLRDPLLKLGKENKTKRGKLSSVLK